MAKKAALSHTEILTDIRKGVFAPVYFLMGDEPFFIDQITNLIVETALREEERDFNQTVVYGNETSMEFVINTARQYPSFAERRLVVVKEAKTLKNLDYLEGYCKNLPPATILVIAYKYGKIDRRTAAAKAIDEKGVLFESVKMYDNKLPEWIASLASSKGYRLDPKATALLAEFVGNDLSRLDSEIDKLIVTLPRETRQINAELVERNIGISKEFNVFELINAISRKEIGRANQIAFFFDKSPESALPRALSQIHSHFLKLFQAHYLPNKSDEMLKQHLGLNYFQLQDFKASLRNYSGVKTLSIISEIRKIESRFKGIGNGGSTDGQLLKELLFKILH